MTEKGILFNGEAVRAILDGLKTQTRRPIVPQPMCRGWYVEFAPYHISDLLYIRETWRDDSFDWEWGTEHKVTYRADAPQSGGPWRPSIHMPRWAARSVRLLVTDVRAQRVQDITRLDCAAEGWPRNDPLTQRDLIIAATLDDDDIIDDAAIEWFADAWDEIYSKRGLGWDANPWVWAYTFELQEVTR